MNNLAHVATLSDIIKKKKKEMKEGLHTVGKFIYTIHEKSSKLSKCLPNVFQQHLYPANGTSFKNNDFSYSVDLYLDQSITLTYHGKYNFTYREVNYHKPKGL